MGLHLENEETVVKTPTFISNNHVFCQLDKKCVRIVRNSRVHYRIHKSPSFVPMLNWMTPINPPSPSQFSFFKIHLNNIPSLFRSSKRPLCSGISTQVLCSLYVPHGRSVSSWLIFVTADVGCPNPGRQVARATETCTVTTNI